MDYINWIRKKVGHDPIILIVALAIIADEKGRILLQRTKDKTSHEWGLPGGMLELGETLENAVIREVKEETDLTVAVKYLLGIYSDRPISLYKNGDRAHVVCCVFACDVIEGVPHPDGVESIEISFIEAAKCKDYMGPNGYIIDDYLGGLRGVAK